MKWKLAIWVHLRYVTCLCIAWLAHLITNQRGSNEGVQWNATEPRQIIFFIFFYLLTGWIGVRQLREQTQAEKCTCPRCRLQGKMGSHGVTGGWLNEAASASLWIETRAAATRLRKGVSVKLWLNHSGDKELNLLGNIKTPQSIFFRNM